MKRMAPEEELQDTTSHSKLEDPPDDPTVRSEAPKLPPETISDNEINERPVREKLKKTSIASIPKDGPVCHDTESKAESETPVSQAILKQPEEDQAQLVQENIKSRSSSRGRPPRKRSFDDLISGEETGGAGIGFLDRSSSLHERKKSKDVRASEVSKKEKRITGDPDASIFLKGETSSSSEDTEDISKPITVASEDPDASAPLEIENSSSSEDTEDISKSNTATSEDPDASIPLKTEINSGTEGTETVGTVNSATPIAENQLAESNTGDTPFSPSKKRSRDQLDTDADREQKIAATEETKAQRRSEEFDRGEVSHIVKIEVKVEVSPVENQNSDGKKETVQEAGETSSLNKVLINSC